MAACLGSAVTTAPGPNAPFLRARRKTTPVPGDPRLRASDADRERTVQLLREHHAEGRLDIEEFHERLNAAYAAKTMGDLDEILGDLPGIDLYRLPSAGLRPAPPGTGGWLPSRRPNSSVARQAGQWAAWRVTS